MSHRDDDYSRLRGMEHRCRQLVEDWIKESKMLVDGSHEIDSAIELLHAINGTDDWEETYRELEAQFEALRREES